MTKKELLKQLNEERLKAEKNRLLAIERGVRFAANYHNGEANALHKALELAKELDDDES